MPPSFWSSTWKEVTHFWFTGLESIREKTTYILKFNSGLLDCTDFEVSFSFLVKNGQIWSNALWPAKSVQANHKYQWPGIADVSHDLFPRSPGNGTVTWVPAMDVLRKTASQGSQGQALGEWCKVITHPLSVTSGSFESEILD